MRVTSCLQSCCLPGACTSLGGCAPSLQFSNKPPSLQVGAAALAGRRAARPRCRWPGGSLPTDRDDLGALLIQGKALSDLGENDRSIASFRRAIAVAPGSAGAQFGLGRELLTAGRPPEAEAAFRRVLEILPHDARAWTDLGIALDLQDKHTEAQAAYASALANAPDLDAARVNMGLSLALSGEAGKALEILRPLGSSPNAPPRVRHDLATALALSGDRAGAERLLRPDLTPEQVQAAMDAYAVLAATPAGSAPAAH